MHEGEDIAFNGLEVCSYRHLQGMAKNMGLPSNVKKIHLIEMIRAKKYCTETDLKAIVDRVKMERKVNAQVKKKKLAKKPFRVQGAEISSTSNSQSPPKTRVPKRTSNFVVQYSPDITQTMMKYQPISNSLRTGTSILQPLKRHIESDRVLRSFNSVRRPNYRIMEQNDCMIGVVDHQESMQEIQQERVQEIRQERAYQSVTNVTIQKHRPVMNAIVLNTDRQLVPISRSSNISKPANRQRKVSGIYPLQPREKPAFEYTPTVSFRRTDGRVTKINAVIQKPLCNALLPKKHAFVTKQRATVTVQDMLNYKVDHTSNDMRKSIEPGPGSSKLYHEIDREIYNEYQTKKERVIEQNNQILISKISNPICSISQITGSRKDLNSSRKVYKGCQRTKTARSKAWSYSVEYQEHDNTDARKEWNIYDINGQLLDTNDQGNEKNAIQCSSHTVKETTQPVSTNYRVTQGRITEPISRNYQVEYQRLNQDLTATTNNARSGVKDQRCNQEIAIRDIENARFDNELFNEETADKNIVYDRSGMKNQQYQEIGVRNIENARSDAKIQKFAQTSDKFIIYARSDMKDQRSNQEIVVRNKHAGSDAKVQRFAQETTDMIYARSDIKDQQCNQELAVVRYKEHESIATITNQTDRSFIYTGSDIKDQHYNLDPTNRNMDYQKRETTDTTSQYPNMASLADVFPNEDYSQEPLEMRRDNSNCKVYYHKKIRAEQIKSQKERDCERLPRINDAFSQFNDVQYRSLTQPLYVQVSAESDLVLPRINGANNTCMLESIYNFKNQFVTNPPVLLIDTTQTFCTYSTKTVSTAVAQPSAADFNNENPYERANPYQQTDTRLDDYLKPEYNRNFRCDEVLSSSTNSIETTNSQELGANVTIPEMVEDALELISQDGDYMERIGMDVRIQCVLCNWAGPKIIMEYHIKKDHGQDIQQQDSNEWSVLLTLGELASKPTWSCQLMQFQDCVYVVSAKYTDGDAVLISLSMIPTEPEITRRARITVYNKVSGRPYTYEGDITDLPDSMPYEYGLDCLTLDVGNLDLLPNSANLRLVNRELVGSPGKAVIGQPELNNIEIIAYVKLID